ncbi:MAG: S8 family serine peptidase [Methanoregula sp.]|nr:S8 family serine peptidase [Methanoregula sp.]
MKVKIMGNEKIAPALRIVMARYHEMGPQGLTRHMKTMGIVAKKDSPKPPRINVFLECKATGKFDQLGTEGIKVNGKKGEIRTAFLPVESLETLAEHRDVRRIFPSRYMKYSLDTAREAVNLPAFLKKKDLSGKGVIVGTVDSGVDPKHEAFRGRILRIWDQELSGTGVPEADFGAELTGNDIIMSRDTVGHGTHVMGIAAGNDATYGGIAPEADLIVVKTDMKDTSIANGVQYIFRIADEMKCPAVVNISLGSHYDSHDGTDPLCRIIDQETGPGRIVCVAAGNEGDDNIHAHAKIKAKKTKTVRFFIPAGDPGAFVLLNGWYAGSDKFRVGVSSPQGMKCPDLGLQDSGEEPKTYDLEDCRVTLANAGPDPGNNDNNFIVYIESADGGRPIPSGIWRLSLKGDQVKNGAVDIWTNTTMPDEIGFTGTSVKDAMKIGSPGAAGSAVTVASYTTKNEWTNIDNEQYTYDAMALDDISSFSSEGPLRNGTKKPDVAAPGAWLVSALSADSEVTRPYYIRPGFRLMCGTSMASPFVAGLAALLLQRDPSAGPADIKKLLKANSHIPGKKAGTHSTKWGYGFIDTEKL